MTERRAAHDRLSTGALARWTRACAIHPWRVVGAWVGIVVLLVVLVATVGGSLRDEFDIPGSDTQRATDLIEAEFAAEQGGVLNIVFAAPQGERLDTPERRAKIMEAVALLRSADFDPTDDKAGIESVSDPFNENSSLATALTEKLLAVSRQQVVQPRAVDISAVVEELAAMLRPLLGAKVDLVLELEASVASVEADPGQLEQIVMNLVINARDAMPDGGRVTVSVATLDRIEHNGYPSASRYVQLAVSDTGTGMDEETLSRAFDPFFTTKELGEGTGLGLATVHGIVAQSGGDIQVTSALGEGTTFRISLPATDAALQQPTLGTATFQTPKLAA